MSKNKFIENIIIDIDTILHGACDITDCLTSAFQNATLPDGILLSPKVLTAIQSNNKQTVLDYVKISIPDIIANGDVPSLHKVYTAICKEFLHQVKSSARIIRKVDTNDLNELKQYYNMYCSSQYPADITKELCKILNLENLFIDICSVYDNSNEDSDYYTTCLEYYKVHNIHNLETVFIVPFLSSIYNTKAQVLDFFIMEMTLFKFFTANTVRNALGNHFKGKVHSIQQYNKIIRLPVRKACLEEMVGGWLVGSFYPSILASKGFEVAVKEMKAGEIAKWHVHKKATEITFIIEGTASMNDLQLKKNEMLLLEPGQGASFTAITDVKTLVIKTPSVANDKFYK